MKQLRVLALLHKDLIPPQDAKKVPEDQYAKWKTEFEVLEALQKLKHEVFVLGVESDLTPIRNAISRCRSPPGTHG